MLTMLTMHHAYWSLAINAFIMMGSNRGNSYQMHGSNYCILQHTIFCVGLYKQYGVLLLISNQGHICINLLIYYK